MVKVEDKLLFKEPIGTQRLIYKAVDKLRQRYQTYTKMDKCISNIFNDDTLIHDIIKKDFYVYKCRVGRVSIRLLYIVRDNDLIVVNHCIKNRIHNQIFGDNYIKMFEKYANKVILSNQ